MYKKKLLILYDKFFHYRITIYTLLAEKFDLTIGYSEGPDITAESFNFKTIRLPIFKYKRFVWHRDDIYKICQNYDVVIALGNIAWLKLDALLLHKERSFKIILWTIGTSTAMGFDNRKRWDSVRDFFYKKADALIFYSDYPIEKYLNRGFDKNKLFVAHNTVEVAKYPENLLKKDSILFIGSLDRRKGLIILLECYKSAYTKNSSIPALNIVGGGSELETVQSWIASNDLSHKIYLHGPVFDPSKKAEFFVKAYACISPNQAGLSVLESMGYGIPFVTSRDSITGGERLNITDGVNGVLTGSSEQIEEVLLDITADPKKYIQMGIKAQEHYSQCRTPVHMSNGLCAAIQYVLS